MVERSLRMSDIYHVYLTTDTSPIYSRSMAYVGQTSIHEMPLWEACIHQPLISLNHQQCKVVRSKILAGLNRTITHPEIYTQITSGFDPRLVNPDAHRSLALSRHFLFQFAIGCGAFPEAYIQIVNNGWVSGGQTSVTIHAEGMLIEAPYLVG